MFVFRWNAHTGEYPGDGEPKPVSFPDPTTAFSIVNGIRCINLASLIELKLASGMTSFERLRDLSDVQQLIQVLNLDEKFAEQLDPYVRAKFDELRTGEGRSRRFKRLWIEKTELLDAILKDGVEIEAVNGGDSWLVTSNPDIAAKYDMHEESEFMSPG